VRSRLDSLRYILVGLGPTHLRIAIDGIDPFQDQIAELVGEAPQIAVDFKADYCDENFARPLGIEVIDVRINGLPFNPLQPPPGGASGAQPIEHVYEFAGILKRVFGLGAVQDGHLRDAIIDAYKENGIDAREWIDPASKSWPTFSRVPDILGDKGDEALVTRFSLLSDLGLFGAGLPVNASFETFLKKRVCLKLNLSVAIVVIVFDRAQKQMVGVYARSNIACVTNT
jgi:hypothetical protein